jgi:hypothetical protein
LPSVRRRTDGGVVNGFNLPMPHTTDSYPMPSAAQPINFAIRHSQVVPWWSGLSANERHPVLLGVVGTVLILGMLLAFVQVVSGAVEQGKARRGATAAHLVATARCTAMRAPSAQDACRVQVAAASNATPLIAMR